MEIAVESLDRFVEQVVVLAENRAVAGEQPFDVAVANPGERTNEGGDVAAVMGIDRADTAIAIDVVATEEDIPEAKSELAVGMPRGKPNLEFNVADLEAVAIFDEVFDFDRRHWHVDFLGLDQGKGF